MKVFLMYKDRDFDVQRKLPPNEEALVQDLEINVLLGAMALDDKYLFDVAKRGVLSGLTDLDTIRYRQRILQDCLKNPAVVREIYEIAVEAIEKEKKSFWWSGSKFPGTILHGAIESLQMFVTRLRRLRAIADTLGGRFESEGFARLFGMLNKELDDGYFAAVQSHLRQLKFRDGVLISGQLGKGNKGTKYTLRQACDRRQSWVKRVFSKKPPEYAFCLSPRDEAGAQALSALRDRGINLVANALAQSTDHILNFFSMLRAELAFYVGCLNLHGQLVRMGEPVCFPLPLGLRERRHSFRGLYDVSLALSMKRKIVGNDGDGDKKNLVIITGANQGGKSTFLRSIGLSQLMMQCGMFAPAESFCANVCDGLFTHYKREEDVAMKSGKLDEELGRMSGIVDHVTPNSLLLLNESFAATNEREGSEIARQIIGALQEKGIKVFFVTHLYEFARYFHGGAMNKVMFLRAERERTFKLVGGEPLETSYGGDLYKKIFGAEIGGPSPEMSGAEREAGGGDGGSRG